MFSLRCSERVCEQGSLSLVEFHMHVAIKDSRLLAPELAVDLTGDGSVASLGNEP